MKFRLILLRDLTILFLFSFDQEIAPESFTQSPIIFGDFLKMGAEKADRLYEEFADHKKLANVLQDVSVSLMLLQGFSFSYTCIIEAPFTGPFIQIQSTDSFDFTCNLTIM